MPSVAPCIADCTPADLLGKPTNCVTTPRFTTPAYLGMFTCDTDLPTGDQAAINAGMLALYESGKFVMTNKLANVTLQEPAYQDILVDDCTYPFQQLQSRSISFEDRTSMDGSNLSPFVAGEFYDYAFWQDKLANQSIIRYMFGYCNGDFRVIDLVGSLRGFITYQKPQQVGATALEVKSFQLAFTGDFLPFTTTTYFNALDAGIPM